MDRRFKYSDEVRATLNNYDLCVYVLGDPRDNTLRYVGYTKSLKSRYNRHVSKRRFGDKTPAHRWLSDLRSLGLYPTLHILESDPSRVNTSTEREWIIRLLDCGIPLLNMRVGTTEVRDVPD